MTISAEESPGKPPDLPELGLVAVGFMLIVYAHFFDWPDPSIVRTILDGLTDEDE